MGYLMKQFITIFIAFLFFGQGSIIGQEVVRYNETNSPLLPSKLSALAIDSTNTIWVGSDTTLFCYENNLWTISVTSSNTFDDIEFSPNGTLYCTVNYPSTIFKKSYSQWDAIVSYNELDYSLGDIAIKNDTAIYFPLINQWPMELGQNNIAVYNGIDSLSIIAPRIMMDGYLSSIYGISSIAPLLEDSLLVTDWQGFHLFDGVEWMLNNPSGYIVGDNYFTTKVKNVKDYVFILGDNFYEYKNNSYSHFPEIDSILVPDSSIATCITIEKSGIYWIGTSNGKIIKYDGYVDTFEITSSPIIDIAADRDGNIWFISKEGLFEFNEDKIVNIKNEPKIISDFRLYQNYPNPFNPSTTINYTLAQSGFVQLKVYDLLGREVAVLVNEDKQIGNYKVEFDAAYLSSGVYFYRMQSGDFFETKKLILLR